MLCDTNGGSLPHEVQRIVGEVVAYFGPDQQIGIHTQNDTGCAVANSVVAVVAGATHVQGTVNGYGERTGNANLMTVVPDLQLKMGVTCLPEGRIERLTAVSRHVAELVNLPPHAADPYVGASAFAHKGGLHTSALGRVGGASYEHIDPTVVGNHTGCWCPTSAAGPACRSRPRSSASTSTTGRPPTCPSGSSTWRPTATSSRRPTPRWSC